VTEAALTKGVEVAIVVTTPSVYCCAVVVHPIVTWYAVWLVAAFIISGQNNGKSRPLHWNLRILAR
jgi:hypothetical protein